MQTNDPLVLDDWDYPCRLRLGRLSQSSNNLGVIIFHYLPANRVVFCIMQSCSVDFCICDCQFAIDGQVAIDGALNTCSWLMGLLKGHFCQKGTVQKYSKFTFR